MKVVEVTEESVNRSHLGESDPCLRFTKTSVNPSISQGLHADKPAGGLSTSDPSKCDHGSEHAGAVEFTWCDNCDPVRAQILDATGNDPGPTPPLYAGRLPAPISGVAPGTCGPEGDGIGALSRKERDVMEHATVWRGSRHRNHFVTEPGCQDWPIVWELCQRGLMRISIASDELTGNMPVFAVTKAGLASLAATSCDNCGASFDNKRPHVCQPEDLCDRLDADVDGLAGDILGLISRIKRIERFCKAHDSALWASLAAPTSGELPPAKEMR